MQTIVAKRPRRWSKNTLILVVASLFVAVAALVVGVVGVTRSAKFVLHGVDAAAEASQIAPDPVTVTDNAVSPPNAAANAAPSPPAVESAAASGSSNGQPSLPAPTPAPASSASSGGADSDSEAAIPPSGGAGQAGTGGTSTGAAAGASPTIWEATLQSAVTLLHQTTISMCGRNTCNVGQVCCNASCGICTAPGATCDQTQCAGAARTPTAVLCGRGQCNDGQVCCNASCGICAAPGATCSQEECR